MKARAYLACGWILLWSSTVFVSAIILFAGH